MDDGWMVAVCWSLGAVVAGVASEIHNDVARAQHEGRAAAHNSERHKRGVRSSGVSDGWWQQQEEMAIDDDDGMVSGQESAMQH
jgi:hypothetical protein